MPPLKKKEKTLVLIDAHAVLHRAFHALPNFISPQGEPTGALYGFVSTFFRTIKEFSPNYIAACYDLPEPTFRHVAYKKYKAKRPKMDEGLIPQIEKSKAFLGLFGVPIYEAPRFEADDILASIVHQLKIKNLKFKIIIVTGDLDTLQLVRPGVEVYTMKRGIQEAVLYDETAVKKRFGFMPGLLPDFKGLRGDPSDNIIGVSGIGEKTAGNLIQHFGSLENIYKKLEKNTESFKKIGITPRIIKILEENKEEAFFSRELAETRTDSPIKFSLSGSEWKLGFDEEKTRDFLQRHGFRSLLGRLPSVVKDTRDKPAFAKATEDKEIKIAFWLLDSRRTNPPTEDVLSFTRTRSAEEAKKILLEKMKKDGLLDLFLKIEQPLSGILSGMEKKGVLVDISYLKKLSGKYHKKIDEIQKNIWEFAGKEFNINSPKQLSEALFSKMGISSQNVRRTSQGTLSTRFSELEKMRDRHPVVEEILKHRELSKLTSTYVDNLPKLADEKNRIHTTFNQTGTVTGRISSSEPNLQNIPTRTDLGKAVRKTFIAPEGWKIISFDYSQIELRVAASLSGDEKLKEAFLKGRDIHAKVASEVFNTPFEKIDAEMRRRAKVINFGILYGMGINSLKKNLNCSKEEAEFFYREYFSDFSGMKKYIEAMKEKTKEKGFTETLFKRRRYLPEINSPMDFVRKEAERMAVNAPLQGTAADIIKIAMIKIDEMIKERFPRGINMILQVHDELLFEAEESIIKESAFFIKKLMEKENILSVPILVEILVGDNWGEMKKFKP